MYLNIIINSDDDSMVGADGWMNYDPIESTAVFVEMVAARIETAYPDHQVSVSADQRIDTLIEGDITDDDRVIINGIISDVWQNWAWLVEA